MIAEQTRGGFTAYEYKELAVREDRASFFLDCYENFGWRQDENFPPRPGGGSIQLKLKRDRKILNKAELTRLQRHFEADMEEIAALERSRRTTATAGALITGLAGTAFIAGSVFAVTAEPPQVWLCVLLAIPGFLGWILPCFLYKRLEAARAKQVAPFIEAKYEEIYELCEKGHSLL